MIFMKLLTQFSIPNPRKADLAKTHNMTSKTVKKPLSNKVLIDFTSSDFVLLRYL